MYTQFRHSQLRRYLIAFGQLFHNISIVRDLSDGTEVQRLVVPLDYGPKERWFVRLAQDPGANLGVSQILPRMTFELGGISYDSARKLNTLNHLSFSNDDGTLSRVKKLFVGVPYNLAFELSVMTKLQSDAFQVVEQILPYFTPDLTLALNPVRELPELIDQVPITLNSVTHTDNYEGDFTVRRAVVWTLTFTMKVFFYGPQRKASRIEHILVDMYNAPFDAILDPPELLKTEADENFRLEDDGGHLFTEDAPDFYQTLGRTARVEIEAVPSDQVPSDNPSTVTTITEYDGNVKRTITGDDEEL